MSNRIRVRGVVKPDPNVNLYVQALLRLVRELDDAQLADVLRRGRERRKQEARDD